MRVRIAALALLLAFAACQRTQPAPAVVLDRATVEATGLDDAALARLRALPDSDEAWAPWFSVSVEPGAPPVAGRYTVEGRAVRFTPLFPLEPGRTYTARLTLSGAPLVAQLTVPGAPAQAAARITAVYPSGEVLPQNLLRLYLQFSTPMAVNGAGPLALLGPDGKALDEPFLPLGYEFWSPDHTRLTLLLDPGRVKRGILGEAVLLQGARYTLVVGAGWRDANGGLTPEYRKTFTAGPPQRRALDLKAWTVSAPPAGSRAPLHIRFDHPLDHALLLSGVGVETDDSELLQGQAVVDPGEGGWSFTPQQPWAAEPHEVAVRPWLEDAAGNRPGRPFERAPQASLQGGKADSEAVLRLPFRPSR